MTNDYAVARLRAEFARQFLARMEAAFADVDFEAPPETVVEALTLAWSRLVHHMEEVEQNACTPAAQTRCNAAAP
ncbi:hypothetical protein D3C71_182370 [compost metagenome]